MSESSTASPPLLTRAFGALLVANVCFGYAFSAFLLLPKFLETELGAGPEDVGALTAAHGAVVVLLLPLLGAAVEQSFEDRATLARAAAPPDSG